ncbi:MAG: hypothetical protein II655_05650, partial [Thermoguttaceae bacterium]|nr:hypothetical protein [Thermoguttaceae bacterium]
MSTTIYKQLTGALAALLLVLGSGVAAHAWDRVKPSPVTVETSIGEDNWVAVKAEPDLEIYGEESPEQIDGSMLTLDATDGEAVETEESFDVDSWFESAESAELDAVEETVEAELDEAVSLDVDDWFESTESEADSVIEEIAEQETDAESYDVDAWFDADADALDVEDAIEEETEEAVSVGELGLEDGVVDLNETSGEPVREEESGAALVPVSNLGDAITVAPGFATLDVAPEDEPAQEETPAEEPVIEEQIAKESLIEADSEKTEEPAAEEPASEEAAAEEPKAEEPAEAAPAAEKADNGVAVSGEPQSPQLATSEWTAAQSSAGDQIWIVMATADGFYCQTLENNAWRVADVKEFYAGDSADRSTVIWAHGFKTDMTGAAESGCSFRNTIDAA